MTGARPVLVGFGPSVYTRAVRMACHALGVGHDWRACNPFEGDASGHPFGRVPVWQEGGRTLYETAAILQWLVLTHGTPETPAQAAAATQVAAVVDHYGYWPLVRQVYAHAVFRPAQGEVGDPDEVAQGVAAAPRVLAALEGISAAGDVLTGQEVGRADWHLAPMIAAFLQAPGAADLLETAPALSRWWDRMRLRPETLATQEFPG